MKTIKIIILIISAIICANCAAAPALAYTIEGKVVYVYDGDTVLLEENTYNITPQALRASSPIRGALPAKQPCTLIRGALVDISSIMLANGAAWHYKAFDKTSAQYDLHYALEQEAKSNKRGLWAQDYPIAPWTWRKEH